MTPAVTLILSGVILMVGWMAALWLVYRKYDNAGIVDVGWAMGLAILAWWYSFSGTGLLSRRLLVAGMVGFWGSRLASHLLLDRVIGRPEDARYVAIKENWKTHLPLKFFLFFQAQGLLDVVLSIPFLLLCMDTSPRVRFMEWCGAALWALALAGESVADAQLKRFKADPSNKGKTCREGLWNTSRHPNYFFEWLIWVAYAVMAWGSPHGSWAILSPVLMLYFLTQVTGVKMTEAHALKTRGEEYRDYQRTTSAFFPWFKKKQ